MDHDNALVEPTTTAATRETEPAVHAAILSGDMGPDVPRSITTDGAGWPLGKLAMMLVAGAAIGYGVSRFWQR